ncbi:hypothetical protein LPB79_16870 [Rhizobium sp. T136]|nr:MULTISPECIES: hypothetical protein [Rhizobium]UFS83858.1 hypothetical protein LPB79_16870 [Rhizobium sp. T136]
MKSEFALKGDGILHERNRHEVHFLELGLLDSIKRGRKQAGSCAFSSSFRTHEEFDDFGTSPRLTWPMQPKTTEPT